LKNNEPFGVLKRLIIRNHAKGENKRSEKQIKLVSFVLLFALLLSLFVNASAVTTDAAPAEAADAGVAGDASAVLINLT
jgi:hypothetical protein